MPCLITLSGFMCKRTHPSVVLPSELAESTFFPMESPSRDFGVGVVGETCVFEVDRGGLDPNGEVEVEARL